MSRPGRFSRFLNLELRGQPEPGALRRAANVARFEDPKPSPALEVDDQPRTARCCASCGVDNGAFHRRCVACGADLTDGSVRAPVLHREALEELAEDVRTRVELEMDGGVALFRRWLRRYVRLHVSPGTWPVLLLSLLVGIAICRPR